MCRFLPSDSLTTPPVRSPGVSTIFSSVTAPAWTRRPPPLIGRRASPLEATSPVLTNAANTPSPASNSLRGISTLGRVSAVVPSSNVCRAVGVASALLSPERREAYAAEVRADYAKISAAHFRAQADKKRLKLKDARANAVTIDFARTPPTKPAFLGIKTFRDYDLAELADYIDWTPFFQTWELTGRYPAILDDPKVGEVARSLYDDARKMLDLIIKEKWFTARATIGFWPANADGDDIAVYADDSRKKQIATFHTLRQQLEKREGRFNAALSDFIAPVASGGPDY